MVAFDPKALSVGEAWVMGRPKRLDGKLAALVRLRPDRLHAVFGKAGWDGERFYGTASVELAKRCPPVAPDWCGSAVLAVGGLLPDCWRMDLQLTLKRGGSYVVEIQASPLPGTDLAALLAGPDASLDQAALAANTDLNEKLRNLLGLDGILLQRVEGRLVLQLSPSP